MMLVAIYVYNICVFLLCNTFLMKIKSRYEYLLTKIATAKRYLNQTIYDIL